MAEAVPKCAPVRLSLDRIAKSETEGSDRVAKSETESDLAGKSETEAFDLFAKSETESDLFAKLETNPDSRALMDRASALTLSA